MNIRQQESYKVVYLMNNYQPN